MGQYTILVVQLSIDEAGVTVGLDDAVVLLSILDITRLLANLSHRQLLHIFKWGMNCLNFLRRFKDFVL